MIAQNKELIAAQTQVANTNQVVANQIGEL